MPTDKVKILVELIARYRVARLSDDSIAIRLGLSRSGLSRLLATPEYKIAQEQALQEITGHMDSILKSRADFLAQGFVKEAVPEALKALVDTVRQRKDLRACLKAATEILDRDPNDTLKMDKKASDGALNGRAERLPDQVFDRVVKEAQLLAG